MEATPRRGTGVGRLRGRGGAGHPLPAARAAGLAGGSHPDPGLLARRRSQPPRSRLRRGRALSRPVNGLPAAPSDARGRVPTDSSFSLVQVSRAEWPTGPLTVEQPAELAILIAMTAAEQMSLADVKNRLSEVVDRVEREHARLVITKHGHPAAVVMSVADLE